MAMTIKNDTISNQFNVLLIGNNPIELGSIYDRLLLLKDKKFIAETAFDVKSVLKGGLRFKPSFILIDDNVGKVQLKKIIEALSKKRQTEHIPITILKNNNAGDSAEGVQEYILKQNADGESIAKALINSLKLKRTQEFLTQTYFRNKNKLKKSLLWN